ncbi:septation protein IspZ [Sphingomonas sp. KR3-1]|uniref:septation protein IspZ n=1 Tax=Sphingomonas sp. KR3-1 TaxID=3156611 RepID=UPI0032B332CA
MRYFLASARPILEDLAGTLAFYFLYLATGSAQLAAAIGLAIGVLQVAVHVLRRQPVPVLLLMGVALTAALGTMTFFTHDARFMLLKPSIIYAAIGTTMLPRGWVTRYVPEIARELLPQSTFDRVGWGWAALTLGTALLNIVLVATLAPKRAALCFAIWAIASKLALFGGQYTVLRLRAGRAYRSRIAQAPAP